MVSPVAFLCFNLVKKHVFILVRQSHHHLSPINTLSLGAQNRLQNEGIKYYLN